VVRDVAVIAFAQMPNVRAETVLNEVEMLMPVIEDVRQRAGLDQQQIGFTCSGSTDYLSGQAFSFVSTLDGVGPWPPIQESHVEMDGAWALYEAWVKLQLGDVDTALVYCYGKSAPGPIHEVLSRQLDPYHVAPLWPDAISLAALQARALIDAGKAGEADFAEVASRSRRNAMNNPNAQLRWNRSAHDLLDEEPIVDPLRKSDCPPITDGACAVILAADDRARELCARPAWIRGIDHRIEPMALGLRDLSVSVSTRMAGEKAGALQGSFDVAELHAPFSPQELILREALGLGDHGNVNPSGGPLAANPVMVAGLTRIGEVAQRIIDGTATRGVAHATSGPCLQQNLVTVLEGEVVA
jgi:acetyl-CoA acetyltransferase